MADIADNAADVEQLQRDQALAKVQRVIDAAAARQAAEDCRDCGDPIPSARREAVAGVERCVHCAEILEKKIGRAA
jgi:phage/conjugal plasmid C-4 type zinc finger TraR family protein